MGLPAPKNPIAEPRTGVVTVEWLTWLQDLADRVLGRGTTPTPPGTPPASETPPAAGTGGTIINNYGSGTPETITKWIAPQTLGDSLISEVGQTVLVGGDLIARSISGAFRVPAHHTTHEAAGNDPLALDALGAASDTLALNATTLAHGLLPKLSGLPTDVLTGTGVYQPVTALPGAPAPHAATHSAAGSDPVALDTLAAPTDTTALNASTTAHGLLPKLSGVSTQFLTGTGVFAAAGAAAPAAHAVTHKAGGADPIALDTLAAPTDITTLNASTSAHGLLRKLSGTTTDVLNGAGVFTAATVTPGNITPVAANRVLGRNVSIAGPAEELTIGAGLAVVTGPTLIATSRASSVFPYGFSIATTEPPSAQQVRFDAIYPYTAVTKIWARFEDSDSEDLYFGWMRIPVGTTLLVQDKDNHLQYGEFRTTGTPIDKTSYVEVPVVWQGNGTAMATQACLVRLTTPANGSMPGLWTNVAFSAADYHAYPSGSWTLTAGDIIANRYTVIGKLAIYTFIISNSAVSASPTILYMANPVTAAAFTYNTGTAVFDAVVGQAFTQADGWIYLLGPGAVAFGATTGRIAFTMVLYLP